MASSVSPTVLRVKRPRDQHASDVLILEFQTHGAGCLADQLASAALLAEQQPQPPRGPACKRRRYVRVCAGADGQVQQPHHLWELLQHHQQQQQQQQPTSPASHPPSQCQDLSNAAGITVVDLQHTPAAGWAVLRNTHQHHHHQQHEQQHLEPAADGAGAGGAPATTTSSSRPVHLPQLSPQEQQQLPLPLQELLLQVLGEQQQQPAANPLTNCGGAAAASKDTADPSTSSSKPRRVLRRRGPPPPPPAPATPAAPAAADTALQNGHSRGDTAQHPQQSSYQQQHHHHQTGYPAAAPEEEGWHSELLPDAQLLATQMVLPSAAAAAAGRAGGQLRGAPLPATEAAAAVGGVAAGDGASEEWLYDVYVAVEGEPAVGMSGQQQGPGWVEHGRAGGGPGGMDELEGLVAAPVIELWEEDAADLDLLLALTGAAPRDVTTRDDPAATALDSEDSNAEGYYAASYPDADTDPEERLSELLGKDEFEGSEGDSVGGVGGGEGGGGVSKHWEWRWLGDGRQSGEVWGGQGSGWLGGRGYAPVEEAAGGRGGRHQHPGPYQGPISNSRSRVGVRAHRRRRGSLSSEDWDVEEYEAAQEAAHRQQLLERLRGL